MDKLLRALGLLFLIGFAVSEVAADSLFSGQTITYIVPTKPGGGYDLMGRLVAKYLEKHLEGSEVRVKNVPGAGHIIGATAIFTAEPDGTTIGTFNTGLLYSQLIGQLKQPLDLSKFEWIGKAATETRVLVVPAASKVRTIADLRNLGRPIKMVSSGLTSAAHYESKLLARAFGLDVQVIPGFEGPEAEMSVLRGEIDATLASGSSIAALIRNGQARVIIEIGGGPNSTFQQARDAAETDIAKFIIATIETQSELSRLTVAPPGMPEDRLSALRAAYMAALTDPELVAEADKLGLPLSPLPGDAVALRVQGVLDMPREQAELIRELVTSE